MCVPQIWFEDIGGLKRSHAHVSTAYCYMIIMPNYILAIHFSCNWMNLQVRDAVDKSAVLESIKDRIDNIVSHKCLFSLFWGF